MTGRGSSPTSSPLQANIERVTDLLDDGVRRDATRRRSSTSTATAFHPKQRKLGAAARATSSFDDVTFRYPDGDENVLEHFNLKVPAGTTVAIVGETGAGKSTLVNLACRFFEPTSGQILIDGAGLPGAQPALAALEHRLRAAERRTCSPARCRRTSATASLDATDEEVEAGGRDRLRRHGRRTSWKRATTATWARAATGSPPAKSS